MPATLTANGVTFGDSTQLNSKYGIIPQSKSSVFYQASAPTGWAKSTAHNNKALRVVSGTGGGSGPPGGGTAFNTSTDVEELSVTLGLGYSFGNDVSSVNIGYEANANEDDYLSHYGTVKIISKF